jgi:hypothetical protein
MKIDNAPQDHSTTYAGHNKLLYGVNESGEYSTVQSTGWKVEEIVTTMAVDEIQRIIDEAKANVEAGLTSPLEYFMAEKRMDVIMLSQATGLFQWRIRRHFKPHIFQRLSSSLLLRYCEVLGITEQELRNYSGKDTHE